MTRSLQPTIMVFGIGKLGGAVVDQLSARHPDATFVMISRDRTRSTKRANLSRYLAAQWGLYPQVFADQCDLLNTTETADILDRWKPDVVFNATTPFPWWKLDHLPAELSKVAARAGSGMWCALDAHLPQKLTKAMQTCGHPSVHVNGCYPDMTNAFLSNESFAPMLGIGNISNLVPGLTLAWAEELQARPDSVGIRIVGHHSVSLFAPSVGCPHAPYELEVSHPEGRLRFSGPDDRPFAVVRARASRVRGLDGLGVTIGSAVTLLDELLGGPRRLHHSPGALGLPGGYPVRLDGRGVPSLELPSGLTTEAAVDVNARAQAFDGVGAVAGGTVSATAQAREAYRQIVGVELPEVVTPELVEPLAKDAVDRLEKQYKLGLRL